MPLFDKIKEKFGKLKVDDEEHFKGNQFLHPNDLLPIDRPRRLSQQFPVEYFYEVKESLGSGTFAKVVAVCDKATSDRYAMKIIDKKKLAGRKVSIREEISILRKVQHTNILSLRPEKSIFETPSHFYLIMPLAQGGELFSEIVERGSFTEADARDVMKQILQAVQYLHEQNIVHRDIKPENLLLSAPFPEGRVLLTDFGLSKVLAHDDFMLKTACGTPAYVAPEVILRKGYGKSCDGWSLGVICYVLLCGYVPFYGESQQAIFYEIVKLEPEFEEEHWKDISASAIHFVRSLLKKDPEERSSIQQALEHHWMTSSHIGVDLLPNYKSIRTFKKAVNAVRAAKRLQRIDSKKTE